MEYLWVISYANILIFRFQTQAEVLGIRSETLQVDLVLELLRSAYKVASIFKCLIDINFIDSMLELEQGQQNGTIPNFTIATAFTLNVTGEIEPILNIVDNSLQVAMNSVDSLREQGTQPSGFYSELIHSNDSTVYFSLSHYADLNQRRAHYSAH